MKNLNFKFIISTLISSIVISSVLYASQSPQDDFTGLYADPSSQSSTTTDNALMARPDFQIPAVSDIDVHINNTTGTDGLQTSFPDDGNQILSKEIDTFDSLEDQDFNSDIFEIRIDNNNQTGYQLTYTSYVAARSSGNVTMLAMVIESESGLKFRDGVDMIDNSLEWENSHNIGYILCTSATDSDPVLHPVLSNLSNVNYHNNGYPGQGSCGAWPRDYAINYIADANGVIPLISNIDPDLATQGEVLQIQLHIPYFELNEAFNTSNDNHFYTDFVTFTLIEF